MDILEELYSKDTKVSYARFLEIEKVAENSNEIYKLFDDFLKMLDDENTYIRVRGFRLICKNSKWDKKNKINKYIDKILLELDDEKPTAVRQCLVALKELVKNKKELRSVIKKKLESINFLKYKDTMQGLIAKDIDEVLKMT